VSGDGYVGIHLRGRMADAELLRRVAAELERLLKPV
jgi:hypothetical protein